MAPPVMFFQFWPLRALHAGLSAQAATMPLVTVVLAAARAASSQRRSAPTPLRADAVPRRRRSASTPFRAEFPHLPCVPQSKRFTNVSSRHGRMRECEGVSKAAIKAKRPHAEILVQIYIHIIQKAPHLVNRCCCSNAPTNLLAAAFS